MTRMPAWALLVLAVGLVVVLAVVVAAAANQPAAPAPAGAKAPPAVAVQKFHWVADLIVYVPKDASIVRNETAPSAFPLWLAPVFTMPGTKTDYQTAGGYWVRRPLEELAPQLAPFDGLKSRDPKVVESTLTRMDERFEYHVLVLAGEGEQGDMIGQYGRLGPLPLRTPDGVDLGADAALVYRAVSVVRPDRALAKGYAVVQFANSMEWGPYSPGSLASSWDIGYGGGSSRLQGRVRLGSCVIGDAGGSCLRKLGYPAAGQQSPEYVHPGFAWLTVAEPGPWKAAG